MCGCQTRVSHLLDLLLTSSAESTVNFTGVLPPHLYSWAKLSQVNTERALHIISDW